MGNGSERETRATSEMKLTEGRVIARKLTFIFTHTHTHTDSY